MTNLEFKKNKSKYEVNAFHSKSSKSHYRNIIDNNPQKFAQILIDLMFEGFPVQKAIKIFNMRLRDRDWLGL